MLTQICEDAQEFTELYFDFPEVPFTPEEEEAFLPPDDVRCYYCQRTPNEIEEYWPEVTGSYLDPVAYVRTEEGTYNPETGGFACTECYVTIGMPSSPTGWVAP